jgi:Fe2+ or Zn2+ uptake regulation protein
VKQCRDGGIPVTAQRRVVLEVVLECDDHPTADEVYAGVIERMPDLSRTTIYRTLETLVQMGVITRACHPGRGVRYDPRTEVHHHLVCLRCGAITDVFDSALDALPVPDTSQYGFAVQDFRVQLRGVCRDCSRKEARQ